ncbi:TetR/AcrR family transcriptional regulator [Paraburkholderia aspalathi]|uniref:Transcriptional regulator, TetR family n=1 Tax=Paraburkholderia aspalathi TaxID=1324617 RepID=A0A1I7EQZ7_9BURK|nr:TetR/AcrR family transcriptional regulator [Paraburkholderia aspalathi]SFU26351.1 transcriptional regulator, TetR family [Paraburkholderia aspalathi]
MSRPSHRETLLSKGMRVVHEHGFNGASVRDIVQAAEVPHGSFTNHFASKEAFGLEVIDLYFADACRDLRETLCNDELAPMFRLRKYIDTSIRHISRNDSRNGCLFGNFAAEAGDSGEAIRLRIVQIFAEIEKCVAYCLAAAVDVRELRADTNCQELAAFIVSSLQGAYLMAKLHRDPTPVVNFKETLFLTILR